MDLRVDPDGLRADAGALDASAHQSAPASACQAAAGDSVSTHLASALSAWAQSLHLLHDHAGQQRAAGGLAVGGTATDLAGADDTNAAAIGGILDGAAPAAGGAPASPSAGELPDVPVPSLPTLPTLAAPMPMAPEQVAAQVHSGPGPQSLRTFAAHIRSTLATSVLNTAAEVRSTGTSVAHHWADGQQQAATNIARHADWLESSLHPQVLALASAADAAATHTDTLIQNTPHPQEFTDLRQRLNVALANYNASGGANAAQVEALSSELTKKRAAAMSAFQDFSTAAPPTIGGAAQPPQPAPPIVHSPSGPFHTLDPHAPAKPGTEHDGPADGRGHRGEGDDSAEGPTSAEHPPAGAATPSANPTAAAPLASPADPNSASMLANVAGMIMGAGTGAVGQVTHGLGGASPLSALSSLSSLPGMGGMPHMGTPEMPDTGGGSGSPSDDAGGDFGSGGTSPAGGGGDGGGGGGAPMSSSSPAVGPPAGSSLAVGSPATGAPTGTGMTGGGMGMMPPMMGGMGAKNDEGRKSEDRRRVVERPMPNTEAVFGEVRRETRRRRDPEKKT
jgi:hypothetical protein